MPEEWTNSTIGAGWFGSCTTGQPPEGLDAEINYAGCQSYLCDGTPVKTLDTGT